MNIPASLWKVLVVKKQILHLQICHSVDPGSLETIECCKDRKAKSMTGLNL
jgi:hypothetical protein